MLTYLLAAGAGAAIVAYSGRPWTRNERIAAGAAGGIALAALLEKASRARLDGLGGVDPTPFRLHPPDPVHPKAYSPRVTRSATGRRRR